MLFSDALERVNRAAEAETNGDPGARAALLREVRYLTLAIETPAETATRIRFQVLESSLNENERLHAANHGERRSPCRIYVSGWQRSLVCSMPLSKTLER